VLAAPLSCSLARALAGGLSRSPAGQPADPVLPASQDARLAASGVQPGWQRGVSAGAGLSPLVQRGRPDASAEASVLVPHASVRGPQAERIGGPVHRYPVQQPGSVL
jgi:hypothetical protein